jgi:hypothetical protein
MHTAQHFTQLATVLNSVTLVLNNGRLDNADSHTPGRFTIALHRDITAIGYCQIIARAIGSNTAAVARYL